MESPAFSDPRQADVAAVRAILDTVTETGKVAKLPTMGTAELCAVGALAHPLLDEHALAWWNAQPAFIVILRLRPDGDAIPVRFLGIADQAAGLRAVLGETAPPGSHQKYEELGPLYIYELASPSKASRTVAGIAADRKRLVIDFYLPGSQTNLPSERFTVTHALRRLRVEQATPTAAPQRVTCSEQELAGLLLDTMTGACQ